MADTLRKRLCGAAEDLNRGETDAILAMCSDDVVLNLGPTATTPGGLSYYGKRSIRELWNETADALYGAVKVRPVSLLSDDQHLVVFVDVAVGTGSRQVENKVVLTGLVGDGGLWEELWLHVDDLPLQEGAHARTKLAPP